MQFIVVPTNVDRVAINRAKFRLFCAAHPITAIHTGQWRERGCIVVLCKLTVANKHGRIPAHEQSRLRQFVFVGIPGSKKKPDPKTAAISSSSSVRSAVGAAAAAAPVVDVSPVVEAKRKRTTKASADIEHAPDLWPGRLELIIGSQIMVLQNQQTQSGIVNGMMAELVDVVLTSQATVRFEPHLQSMGTGGGVHTVDSVNVSALILRYSDIRWRNRNIFETLPPGCFPLTAFTSYRSAKCYVNMHEKRQLLNVTMTQFPCSPAFAITGHKVQGQTLDQLIVGSWRPPPRGRDAAGRSRPPIIRSIGADGYLYVLLSRVRTAANLFIINPLPLDLRMYPTRVSVLEELERLRKFIFEPTLQRLIAMATAELANRPSAVARVVPAVAQRGVPATVVLAATGVSVHVASAMVVPDQSLQSVGRRAPLPSSVTGAVVVPPVVPVPLAPVIKNCRLCGMPVRLGMACTGCMSVVDRRHAVRVRTPSKRKCPEQPASPPSRSASVRARTDRVSATQPVTGSQPLVVSSSSSAPAVWKVIELEWKCVLCHTMNRATRQVCVKCKCRSRYVSDGTL